MVACSSKSHRSNVSSCSAVTTALSLLTLLSDYSTAGSVSSESICIYAGGDVAASIADVKTVEEHLKPADLQPFQCHLQQASIVMLDANLSPETLEVTTSLCSAYNTWYSIYACTLKCNGGPFQAVSRPQ